MELNDLQLLKKLNHGLYQLLDKPEPGLLGWWITVGRNLEELRKEIDELIGKEK